MEPGPAKRHLDMKDELSERAPSSHGSGSRRPKSRRIGSGEGSVGGRSGNGDARGRSAAAAAFSARSGAASARSGAASARSGAASARSGPASARSGGGSARSGGGRSGGGRSGGGRSGGGRSGGGRSGAAGKREGSRASGGREAPPANNIKSEETAQKPLSREQLLAKQDREDRDALIKRLFDILNRWGNATPAEGLSSAKLRRYAELRGFDGDHDEWATEFASLCTSRSWDPRGPKREQFEDLVSTGEGQPSLDELRFMIAGETTAGPVGTRIHWLTRKPLIAEDSVEEKHSSGLTKKDIASIMSRALNKEAKIDDVAARLVAKLAEKVLDEVVGSAAMIARHRGSTTLEASDLQVILSQYCRPHLSDRLS